MTLFIKIFLMGIWDRFRGDDNLGIRKNVDAAIMAYIALLILGQFGIEYNWWQGTIYILCFVLAMAQSYGGFWGPILGDRDMIKSSDDKWPWWQIGPFRESRFLAANARGVVAALCAAPGCYVIDNYHTLYALFYAFVIPPYLTRWILDQMSTRTYDKLVSFLILIQFVDPKRPEKAPWNISECIRGWQIGFTLALSFGIVRVFL